APRYRAVLPGDDKVDPRPARISYVCSGATRDAARQAAPTVPHFVLEGNMFDCFKSQKAQAPTKKQRTLADLLKIAHKQPWYPRLAGLVGTKTADAALAMSYNIGGALAQGDEQVLGAHLNGLCLTEHMHILHGCKDIDAILADAMAGRFSSNRDPARF